MSPYGKCRGRAIGSPAYRLANPRHLEDAPMLYEVRTYTLRPGTLAEFEERFAKRLPCGHHCRTSLAAETVRSGSD